MHRNHFSFALRGAVTIGLTAALVACADVGVELTATATHHTRNGVAAKLEARLQFPAPQQRANIGHASHDHLNDTIPPAVVDLIKSFEGFRAHAYKDAGGTYTIGYGTTEGVRPGDTITEAEATRHLLDDLAKAAQGVRRLVTVPLRDHESHALTSFVYNLGVGNLARSTLLKRLNANDRVGAAQEFRNWVFVGNTMLPGLKVRREVERSLFLGELPGT
ncbi:lysozyme [Marinibaculum pumilum]|uniref:Lysozyme n=1 Tax=Marinibaculum pumilum TaxID=1766165 RepID=A0ABV7L767_9PROT